MGKHNMDYLLGGNWLSEDSWIYYNNQIALVKACLAQAGRRIEAQQLSPEEALDAEMGELRNTVTLQINFYSNKDLDPENQVMDLDVLFRGLIEIIKQQPEEKQNSFNKLWAQNTYGETAKQIRDRYYKCPRGLP